MLIKVHPVCHVMVKFGGKLTSCLARELTNDCSSELDSPTPTSTRPSTLAVCADSPRSLVLRDASSLATAPSGSGSGSSAAAAGRGDGGGAPESDAEDPVRADDVCWRWLLVPAPDNGAPSSPPAPWLLLPLPSAISNHAQSAGTHARTHARGPSITL
jgi:hypothetical protein